VKITGADGKPLIGQLTGPGLLAPAGKVEAGKVARELHFLVPELKAGASADFKAVLSTEGTTDGERFAWKDTAGDHADLLFGDQPVLRYEYKTIDESTPAARELTFKPFHHLYDPSGAVRVTKGPGGEFTHHRGLFYGFRLCTYGDKKTADVWHCIKGAYQSHERFLAEEAGPVLGRHRVEIAWHGEDKAVFAVEERELTAYHIPGGQLIEFSSRVRTKAGPLKVGGDPQHAGFHFRADNAVAVAAKMKKETYYLRPDGAGKPGETRNWPGDKGHVNLPWDAMSFVLGGERYTAAYLDRPANPKEARFSERDYGRFGSYFEREIKEGDPLDVSYRIWLQKGEAKGGDIQALDDDFAKPADVKVK
jgi:hypothetical protein